MADLRIEQLPTALALALGDLFPLAAVNSQIQTGYEAKHITAAEVAAAILTTFEQSTLTTASKTIVGALNEIASGGGGGGSSVLSGTSNPSSLQGNDNDLYVKYATSGNDVTVVGFYVKLSGAWVPISSGGGGSTVTITPSLQSGTKVADYSIDGTSGAIYAPPSGDTVSVTPITSTGTKIATIGVNSTDYDIYAPESEDIALSDLTDVEISAPSNGQTLKYRAIPNERTASGAIATFATPFDLPLIEHKVSIVAQQSGSGDPSPSNVRPLSGFSSVTISHSGEDTSDPTEYEIDLDDTIYGGELDVKRGVLTVTKRFIDLTQIGWEKNVTQTNPNGTYYAAAGDFSDCGDFATILSNIGVAGNGNIPTSPANSFWFNAARTGIRWIWGSPNGGSSITDLQNYIANNDAYLTVELTTPVEVTIDPVILEALTGRNNIWADTGDTEVKYIYDYSDSWENGESGTTTTITPTLATGTKIADYELDGVEGSLYAPESGDTVTITPTLLTGSKVADYSINGVSGALYAPTGGGSGSDEIFVIGGQIDEQSGDPVIDKTAQQIYSAITSGLTIIHVWTSITASQTFKEVFTCTTCKDNSNGLFDLEFSMLDTINAHNIKKTHIINDALGLSFGHFDTVKMLAGYSLYQTLEQGETSVEFASRDFDNDRAGIDIYTDKIGVNPVSVTVDTSGNFPVMTVTFEQQASDVEVKVVVTL